MGQAVDDGFGPGRGLMALATALAELEARTRPVAGVERVSLRNGLGRILADDIVAATHLPPDDNAAVDGYAMRFDDLPPAAASRLPVIGRAAAGHPYAGAVPPGCAVRIFTGAPVPAGLDTIVMQEDCRGEDDLVVIPPVRMRGANLRRAGEDVVAGSTVLTRGTRLEPPHIGLAAALGQAAVPVFRPLRVAVFSTGDELTEPDQAPVPGRIRDANRYALMALLQRLGTDVSDLGILPDRLEAIRDGLAAAAGQHDLIVTSGGMSVGEEDHVKAAVESLGRLHLWRLAIKPGRPIGLGRVAGVPFIGLPGNPVAMVVTFLRVARPLVIKLGGGVNEALPCYPVRADFSLKKKPGRREWVRAVLVRGAEAAGWADGLPLARMWPRQGSGILTSLVAADGLIELDEDLAQVEPGMTVPFLPFHGLM
ncbi:MAG: molybdopterin molybdenumtransferase MoeA [Rhodospirillales bacterium]|nr:MAG: molybdopterin molybdenumtransferase MoeA [Rhodospirillales bacterium]